jgi:hypothetical protein
VQGNSRGNDGKARRMHFFQVYLMVGAIVFLGVVFAVAYWFVKTSKSDGRR